MFIVRQNPKGARPLTGFPIGTDPATGLMDYKVGYCPCGCHEPLFIRTLEIREVVDYFGLSEYFCGHEEKKKWLFSPIPRLKKRIVETLGGVYND